MTSNSHDDLHLDRLVDGELSPADYRQTLAALEEEPGGWRRCALAFLEAQAWRQDLGLMRREAAAPPPSHIAPRSWPRTLGTLLAMAACFLVAFSLGAFITGPLPGMKSPTQPSVAKNDPAASPTAPAERPQVAAVPAKPAPQPGRTPAGHVTLVMQGANGQNQELDVPVYSPADGAAALAEQPSAIPPEVLAALERMGHNVRRQQRLVPMDLEDGRRILVPVEQLEIVPTGGRAYQ